MSSTLQWLGRTTLALLLVVGLPQFAHATSLTSSRRATGFMNGLWVADAPSIVG